LKLQQKIEVSDTKPAQAFGVEYIGSNVSTDGSDATTRSRDGPTTVEVQFRYRAKVVALAEHTGASG